MMFTCMIVDDEPLAVTLLQQYIEQVPFLSLKHSCYNAMEALSFLQKEQVDILFLDINMPKLTGMELSSIVKGRCHIIFTTAYSHHAVESYEKNAVDYLVKPIRFERFLVAVNKVTDIPRAEKEITSDAGTDKSSQSFFIKSGKAIIRLAYPDILFIEGLKDYVIIHTQQSKHTVYKRMKDLEESLPASFLRIHNSYIININSVSRIEDYTVFIQSHQLPVSDKYRAVLMQKINARIL